MRIRAYIRLQDCSTVKDRRAYIGRREAHGIAKGEIHYYAVEGKSWAHIRRVLKVFDVMGATSADKITALAYVTDCGDAPGKLWRLDEREIPPAARFENVRDRICAPELSSFGAGAIERVIS